MSEFTPGPWRLHPPSDVFHESLNEFQRVAQRNHTIYQSGDGSVFVADIHVTSFGSAHDDGNEGAANARLIAACPALLEACENASKLIETARRYFPKSIKHSDRFQLENTCAAIGAAIHQATASPQPDR